MNPAEQAGLHFGPAARWDRLRQRADLLARLRNFFQQRGFLEVETPLLSAETVVDQYIDPLSVTLFDDPRSPDYGPKLWLQTSPEFAMKRLLATGGAEAIYQITRAFRGGERGTLHNPEFTMVEWYRVGDDYKAGIDLLATLASEILSRGPARRTSYREAFVAHLGLDPHTATNTELRDRANSDSSACPPSFELDDRDNWLNYLLAHFIEPKLGVSQPEIIFDFPASQAALARIREEPLRSSGAESPEFVSVAERFELYVQGIELANGYHELLDPDLLVARNRHNNEIRARELKPPLPESSRLLEAMRHGLPPCTGVALGFDRLAMIACGASSIQEVMAFPIDRA